MLFRSAKAKTTEMAMLGAADQASAVLIIMPITSPTAQPVKQCRVALAETLFNE